jgi:hypothetical protein
MDIFRGGVRLHVAEFSSGWLRRAASLSSAVGGRISRLRLRRPRHRLLRRRTDVADTRALATFVCWNVTSAVSKNWPEIKDFTRSHIGTL